jgi:hypothetical protein
VTRGESDVRSECDCAARASFKATINSAAGTIDEVQVTNTNAPSRVSGNQVRPRSFEWVWIGAGLWGLVGAVIAWRGMSEVNADAKRWVGIASTVLPLCSVAGALLIKRRRNFGVAGGLLLVSTGTPTYFAWPLNIIPILLIVGLVITMRMSGRGALDANSPSA